MRLFVLLFLIGVCTTQVSGSCIRYSNDFLQWSGVNYISEVSSTNSPPPETTTGTATTTSTSIPDTTPAPTTTGTPSTTTTIPPPTTVTTTSTSIPDTTPPPTTTAMPPPTTAVPAAFTNEEPTTTVSTTTTVPTTTTISTTTTVPTTTTTDPYASYELTTIVISGHNTEMGQVIFLKGGLDYNAYGCTDENPDACMIPVVHLTEGADPSHLAWAENDNYLDWGVETGQGTYDGLEAQGSPGYWEDGSWVFEFLMDCDATDDGWFEVKGFFQDYNWNYNYWEDWISDYDQCAAHGNHQAICGQYNYFTWNYNYCEHY